MVLAEPFILDLDKLPLDNPDNGSDGRVGVKWVKTRAQTKTKTSEVYTLTKTVAEHFYSTKGTDNRCAGLRTSRINIPKVRYNTLLLHSCIKCKRLSEALKINNIKRLLYVTSLWKVNVYVCNDCK
ncbi:hypothetical protein E3N88_20118 [Mikania micrantha]|uniref:Uncharacterized protein n=1 Tax=Mikania micrantha TaxID=192012 RepID=A0A5N6NIP9_9ASTR|nr:hypothetical protein E3N88_20118 [Mikania micrantha]